MKRKKSRLARISGCVIAAAALSGCNAAPLDSADDDRSAGADSALAVGSLGNPGVVPPNAHPHGLSLAEWSAVWWQQILAIPDLPPPDRPNPVFDTTGVSCGEGAHGHVWFLAGTAGGPPVTRRCTIPTGTHILFPLLNTADDNNSCVPPLVDCSGSPSLEACLTEDARMLLPANQVQLSAMVDGVSLKNLLDYVQTSKLFLFTGSTTLQHWDSCITGSPQKAVAYGWWIMLEPLRPGTHMLHFRGSLGGFSVDVTYILQIVH